MPRGGHCTALHYTALAEGWLCSRCSPAPRVWSDPRCSLHTNTSHELGRGPITDLTGTTVHRRRQRSQAARSRNARSARLAHRLTLAITRGLAWRLHAQPREHRRTLSLCAWLCALVAPALECMLLVAASRSITSPRPPMAPARHSSLVIHRLLPNPRILPCTCEGFAPQTKIQA